MIRAITYGRPGPTSNVIVYDVLRAALDVLYTGRPILYGRPGPTPDVITYDAIGGVKGVRHT